VLTVIWLHVSHGMVRTVFMQHGCHHVTLQGKGVRACGRRHNKCKFLT